MVEILPVALLFSVVIALARLRRQGELEAMAGAGAGPLRLCLPILAAGLLCTVISFTLNEILVPPCERKADQVSHGKRISALTGLQLAPRWLRQGQWFLSLEQQREKKRLLALKVNSSFYVVQRIDGTIDTERNNLFSAGKLTDFSREGFSRRAGPLLLPPLLQALTLLWPIAQSPAEVQNSLSLRRNLRQLEAAGHVRPTEKILLHTKVAFPLFCLVMALLACPFALGHRRRTASGDLFVALGLTLAIWCLLSVGWIGGRVGWFSPAISVWGPTFLGFALGAILLGRTR